MQSFEFVFSYLSFHFICLFLLSMIFMGMRRGLRPGQKIFIDPYLVFMYLFGGLVLLTDALWQILLITGSPLWLSYLVNILYFISSTLGILSWFRFCTFTVENVFYKKKILKIISAIPAFCICVLFLSAPFNGLIFSIKDGMYFRGPLFVLDPVIKMLYLFTTSLITALIAIRTKNRKLRHICISFLLYEIPVIICGILQTVTGYDFNCIGLTISLLLLYTRGIANATRDNSELINSVLGSFDASFIVNADKDTIKAFYVDEKYKNSNGVPLRPGYLEWIGESINETVVPEDKNYALENFDLGFITQKVKNERFFSIIYRTHGKDQKILYHKTTFMNAESKFGQNEFLMCVQSIDLDKYALDGAAEDTDNNDKLYKINEDIFLIAGAVIEARDAESGEHVFRVKEYTRLLANAIMENFPEYGLTNELVSYITAASALHDLGKIMIPDSILLKAGKLTPEEFEIMKTHTVKGCELIDRFPIESAENYIKAAREICMWHHERYDGKGYPDGLSGENIPISAQIVGVVDCYDALTTKRDYKDASTPDEAFEMIKNGECGVFSDKILLCFEKVKDSFASLAAHS